MEETIREEIKKYREYCINSPIEYPAWITQIPAKGENKKRSIFNRFQKEKKEVASGSHKMWAKYRFSPELYEKFEDEIEEINSGGQNKFIDFMKKGYFISEPNFFVHALRSVKAYEMNHPDKALGIDGTVYYTFMSNAEYQKFSKDVMKNAFNLDNVVELHYDRV